MKEEGMFYPLKLVGNNKKLYYSAMFTGLTILAIVVFIAGYLKDL